MESLPKEIKLVMIKFCDSSSMINLTMVDKEFRQLVLSTSREIKCKQNVRVSCYHDDIISIMGMEIFSEWINVGMEVACRHGNMFLAKWFLYHDALVNFNIYLHAFRSNLKLFEYLLDKKGPCDIISFALRDRDMKRIQYLEEKGLFNYVKTKHERPLYASGNLDLIHKYEDDIDYKYLLYESCLMNDVEMIKHAVKCGAQPYYKCLSGAARYGRLEAVMYLLESMELYDEIFLETSISNNVDLMIYLQSIREYYTVNMLDNAISYGNEEMAVYLKDKVGKYDRKIMFRRACDSKRIKLIREFIVEDVKDEFPDLCFFGHLSIVKLLYEQGGCDVAKGLQNAMSTNNREIVIFLESVI